MKNKLSIDDPSLRAELEDLGVQLVRGIASDLIRSGEIDPRGKSVTKLQSEILKCIRTLLDEGAFECIVPDHREELYKTGVRFRKNAQFEYAILFYATWFEHWLNSLIYFCGRRQNLGGREISGLIRQASLREKLSFSGGLESLFLATQIKPLCTEIIGDVTEIARTRNEFVHYKWEGIPADDDELQDLKLKALCFKAEKCMAVLKEFEISELMYGVRIDNHPVRTNANALL